MWKYQESPKSCHSHVAQVARKRQNGESYCGNRRDGHWDWTPLHSSESSAVLSELRDLLDLTAFWFSFFFFSPKYHLPSTITGKLTILEDHKDYSN